MSLGLLVGAGLLSAPATLPDQRVDRDVDQELVDLLCQDSGWVDETFHEIVATSWADPPRGGEVQPVARPRRGGPPGRRAPLTSAVARTQWTARAHGRQRSPPAMA